MGTHITDWEKFREFALMHGDKTQVEMAELWDDQISDACGELRSAHNLTSPRENWFYSKKKTYGYRERDEAKRETFIAQLSKLPQELIVYLDESGMDSRDEYDYGWIELGQRFHALKSGRREGRINMIAALCNQNLIAPFTLCGSM